MKLITLDEVYYMWRLFTQVHKINFGDFYDYQKNTLGYKII